MKHPRAAYLLLLLASLGAAHLPAQMAPEVALRYARFDPLAATPSVPASLQAGREANLWIVQFANKPTEQDRQEIKGTGAEVHCYLPHWSHIVRTSASNAAALRKVRSVRWVGEYHPAYRIDPELLAIDGVRKDLAADTYNLVVVDKRRDKPALAQGVFRLGGTVTHEQPGSLLLEVRLTRDQLLAVAGLDQVLWIDRSVAAARDMDNARAQTGADHIETVGGYRGQGVRGHVYEGIQADHPDFTQPPTAVLSCPTADDHGHATAGIVFGNGSSHPAARGMAPEATVFFTNDLCVQAGVSRWQVVQSLVQTHEVMFTTASWGNGLSTTYTSVSADADDIVFDHGIAWTQSQSNNGNQQSRPQAWAKNVFSVGGVRHFDNSDPADDSWSGGASIGPAADGRIKPDFCSYYDATHTSDRTGAAGYDPGDSFAAFGGTSGATPIVAGCNALAIQMYTDGLFGPLRVPGGTRFQNRPACTTLKALQIAAASQYAFGAASSDNRREHQGWGHPNLRSMYDDRQRMFVVDESQPLQQGQAFRYRIAVAPGRPSLKAAMTFADPAANPSALFSRVNDLTLRAIAPDGTVYWGNHGLRDGTVSLAGGGADAIDTVECVVVDNPQAGTWSIDVIADLVVVDSHAATAAVDADFGLVVRGGTYVGPGLAGTATRYGHSCPGSVPGAPGICLAANDVPNKTSVSLRANAGYALELVAPVALEVVGFEVYANSTIGAPQVLPASIRVLDGTGVPSIALATGTLAVDANPGWSVASIGPVTIAAGQTFYVGFDTPAIPPSAWDATNGGIDVPYFRFEAGAWGARTTGRFEWSVRIRCRPTTTLAPRLDAAGIMDIGQTFTVATADALPNTWAATAIGTSNTTAFGLPLPIALDGIGATGCVLWTNEELLFVGQTDATGTFAIVLPVPVIPAFVGMHFYHQGVVYDAAANTVGLVFTDALDVHVGG